MTGEGDSTSSGHLTLATANAGVAGVSGSVDLRSGTSLAGSSGAVDLSTGAATEGAGGAIGLLVGEGGSDAASVAELFQAVNRWSSARAGGSLLRYACSRRAK